MPLTIDELVVYVPSQDFLLSQRFYCALGFSLTDGWDGTKDCRLGSAVFRLQNYYKKDWAENFMMKLQVDDLEAWHAHAKDVINNYDFAHARYDEKIDLAGDTKVFHVWDPCGVLLIFLD